MNDLSVTTFTQDGYIKQVEYAQKAVSDSETILGVRCKDGVILGAEKKLQTKLMVEDSDRRIYNIQKNIGMIVGGRIPDGRNVVHRARKEAQEYEKHFAMSVSGRILSERTGQYLHAHTLYGAYRPFGCSVIISSYDPIDGLQLHQSDNAGYCLGYYACAQGQGKQEVMAHFGRRNFRDLTCEEALPYVILALNKARKEANEGIYQYEVSWITEQNNYVHCHVPNDIRDAAQAQAEAMIEAEDSA
ncbi:hypothetical protein ABPG72_004042 [Tetrahymena utriculariae]